MGKDIENNKYMTKWILSIIVSVFLIAFTPQEATACEIEFEILKGEKEVYNVGDTLIVKVVVKLTHRVCPVAMKETKFKLNGMKVIKSTGWKKLSENDYTRKLIIVITGKKGKKVSINAIRECEKDGGFGSMKLETVEVK